jgi:hypothetical protein
LPASARAGGLSTLIFYAEVLLRFEFVYFRRNVFHSNSKKNKLLWMCVEDIVERAQTAWKTIVNGYLDDIVERATLFTDIKTWIIQNTANQWSDTCSRKLHRWQQVSRFGSSGGMSLSLWLNLSLSFSLSLSLFVSLSVSLSLSQSVFALSLYFSQSVYVSFCLSLSLSLQYLTQASEHLGCLMRNCPMRTKLFVIALLLRGRQRIIWELELLTRKPEWLMIRLWGQTGYLCQ